MAQQGTHKAIDRFRDFAYKVSKNHTRICWVLKCDIRKFFASVDQAILLGILSTYIPDKKIVALIAEIVGSFHSTEAGRGLPLGNLTSQLLVNVYMNEFDQFVKHKLKAQFYVRYADDFVIFSHDRQRLASLIPQIGMFLENQLKLELHPKKVSITTLTSGVDFLGWVHFPDHRVLRTATKRRMFQGIKAQDGKRETVQSYLGLLSHGNTKKLREKLEERIDDI